MMRQIFFPSPHLCRLHVVFISFILIGACLTACQSTPSIIGKNCGTINLAAGADLPDAGPPDMIDCFQQAHVHCTAATLLVSSAELDFNTTDTYTTQTSGNHCALHLDSDRYFQPGHSDSISSYSCSGLDRQLYGLVLHECGSAHNMVIPVPFPSVVYPLIDGAIGAPGREGTHGTSCGEFSVNQLSVPTGLSFTVVNPPGGQGAFSCLSNAYQFCLNPQQAIPAVMSFLVNNIPNPDVPLSGKHWIIAQKQANGCRIQDVFAVQHPKVADVHYYTTFPYVASYPCIAMKAQNNSLHLSNCGAEGNIDIT